MLTTASSEMLSGANRRLAAVAFVDVVGFSILMAQDEERTYIRWTELVDQVLRTHTATWNGHIIKSTGHGLLVDFPSIGNAVQWALAVQRVVGERNRAALGQFVRIHAEQTWFLRTIEIQTTGVIPGPNA